MIKPDYEEEGIQLYLGDCLEVMKKIPDKSIDLVLTSPPYYNQRDYSQWKCFNDYLLFLNYIFMGIKRLLSDCGVVFWNIGDDRTIDLPSFTSVEMEKCGLKYQDTIIWEKPGILSARGSFICDGLYYPYFKHEHIYIYTKNGLKTKMDNGSIYLARKNNTNIWKIKTASDNFDHPAKFHPDLPSYGIQFYTHKNQTVLDPFMGSGTTGVACKELGRNFIGIEIEPKYFEIAKRRIQNTMKNLL